MPRHIRRGKMQATVEHVFAAQEQRLRRVVGTIGLARATTKLGPANLTYNLPRLARLAA